MKILAVITVVFLPGAFVAALFSMSMFHWPDGSAGAWVSPAFWIYWAVAVPLTIFVIALWFFWWQWQNARFQEKLAKVRGEERRRRTAAPPLVKYFAGGPWPGRRPRMETDSSGFRRRRYEVRLEDDMEVEKERRRVRQEILLAPPGRRQGLVLMLEEMGQPHIPEMQTAGGLKWGETE